MKSIRILQVAIAFSFIFLGACNKDVSSSVAPPPSDEVGEREASEKLQFWSEYFLNIPTSDRDPGYVTRGDLLPGKGSNPIAELRLGTEVGIHEDTISWEYMHDFTQMHLPHDGIDPTVFDSAYSPSLTVVAMEIAHRKAMNAPQSPRRDSVMEYWMDMLVLHRGAETKIMAELARALQPIVGSAKYNAYRDYIVDRAEKDLMELTPALEEARSRIELGEEDLSENYVFQYDLQHYMEQYLKAEEALGMLSVTR